MRKWVLLVNVIKPITVFGILEDNLSNIQSKIARVYVSRRNVVNQGHTRYMYLQKTYFSIPRNKLLSTLEPSSITLD